MKTTLSLILSAFAFTSLCHAELKLPSIIGDHMVLQQKQEDPIWGWDTPGTTITVTFAGQVKSAKADKDGNWLVKLDPMPANSAAQVMTIKGSSERTLQNILIGEVWMCSGQSNMGMWLIGSTDGEIEVLGAKLPELRLITVPNVGTQELQNDFKGKWDICTPETSSSFSAVGFYFGRHLQRILGVPVGLINNSWGGSAAEAWVRRSSLEKDERFKRLMDSTRQKENTVTADDYLKGNSRPGNIFNGMLYPTLGYGIKGVIWYQGESNADQAWEYAQLFPYLIEQWRAEWKQGDFPFYWVQIADYLAESATPGDSTWAELRESQTKTQTLPNTGQAVIIDIGEGKDIHPTNKSDVGARLARLALAKDYGFKVAFHSPEFKNLKIKEHKAVVTLEMFGGKLRPFDVEDALGFAVCGEDRVWHKANGKITGDDTVEITSEAVAKPIAVRYAWADNPVCNLFSADGLPVTPFRTDDFPMVTAPKP